MPRRSVAALATVSVITEHRPAPPESLTEEQSCEWVAIVGRMPAKWFPRETHGLLTAYVQHLSALKMLSGMIDEFRAEWTVDPDGLVRLDKLLQMREREARSMSSLATRMRISQQSQYQKDRSVSGLKAPFSGSVPWEKSK